MGFKVSLVKEKIAIKLYYDLMGVFMNIRGVNRITQNFILFFYF